MDSFKAPLQIIGVNPFVFVPERILKNIFEAAEKQTSPIRIKGTVNGVPFRQTLVRFEGEWRLYINTKMLKASPKRIGEEVTVSVAYDTESREVKTPAAFALELAKNETAQKVFAALPPSRQLEIVRYLANLKTEEALNRNVNKAIQFLLGKTRFVGRDSP